MTEGRQVYFVAEKLPPVHAVYDLALRLYLAGLLTEAARDDYVTRAGMVVVPAPA